MELNGILMDGRRKFFLAVAVAIAAEGGSYCGRWRMRLPGIAFAGKRMPAAHPLKGRGRIAAAPVCEDLGGNPLYVYAVSRRGFATGPANPDRRR